jgi:hypothetical protein
LPRSATDFFFSLAVTPPPRSDFVLFCAPSVQIYIDSPFIPRPIGIGPFYAADLSSIAQDYWAM